MNRCIALIPALCIALTVAADTSVAQPPSNVQARLEAMAAKDPKIAAALQALSEFQAEEDFTEEEFKKRTQIEWTQFRVAANGHYILGTSGSGGGSIGAGMGSFIRWTDKDTGKEKSLSFMARPLYLADKGLVLDVTIQPSDQPASTTRYKFERFGAVTVPLAEAADGTSYIARFVPDLNSKTAVVDYFDHPVLTFKSAMLFVDDTYAGAFGACGEVIRVTSPDLDQSFSFGLKPFQGADIVGYTDGQSIYFDLDDRHYKLVSLAPITALAPSGKLWNVYVRAQPAVSNESVSACTYDSLFLKDLMDSMGGN